MVDAASTPPHSQPTPHKPARTRQPSIQIDNDCPNAPRTTRYVIHEAPASLVPPPDLNEFLPAPFGQTRNRASRTLAASSIRVCRRDTDLQGARMSSTARRGQTQLLGLSQVIKVRNTFFSSSKFYLPCIHNDFLRTPTWNPTVDIQHFRRRSCQVDFTVTKPFKFRIDKARNNS